MVALVTVVQRLLPVAVLLRVPLQRQRRLRLLRNKYSLHSDSSAMVALAAIADASTQRTSCPCLTPTSTPLENTSARVDAC